MIKFDEVLISILKQLNALKIENPLKCDAFSEMH